VTRLPLVFHPGVEDDVAAIYDYYEQFDPALPSRFDVRLEEQVERVERFPESGAFLFGSYRRVVLKRFPYMAVYVVRR
jgi:plasmid stabilization system protein ParE